MAVFIGSTPNTTEEDLKVAKGILNGDINVDNSINELKTIFQKEYQGKSIYLFNRGRDGMYFLFQNLNLQPDDEIILQGFTCIAVLAPILWTKGKPVFVDIKRDTFNMDLEKMREKISEKTKVIVVQHTFGNIADMVKIREIVEQENAKREDGNDIFILEDCAHILDFSNKEIGRYSDAFFFSFAQDKSISSTQGSALVINKRHSLSGELDERYDEVEEFSKKDELYNAKYILSWDKIKKNYFKKILLAKITVGKVLLLWYRFTGAIKKQASGDTVDFDGIYKMSNIQAKLLLIQLKYLSMFNQHRKIISGIYGDSKMFLRFPLLLQNASEIRERLKEIGVISGRWYSTPIFPISWNKLECLGYRMGDCPEVEFCSQHILNLPTNIEVDENKAREIKRIIDKYAKPI